MIMNELSELFLSWAGVAPENVVPLAESGSDRKYFRLSAGGGVTGAASAASAAGAAGVVGGATSGGEAGEASEAGSAMTCIGVMSDNIAENEAFIYLARHFRAAGIAVPEVYAVGQDRKAYIQEDLGTESLFAAVAEGRGRAISLFKRQADEAAYSPAEAEMLCKAIGKLAEIQVRGAEGLDFSRCYPVPAMDARSIMFDLNYFKYCYLLPTGIEYNEVRLQDEFEKLAEDLLSEDFDTFMYRDFQARNVMLKDGEPYFIDFQGGRRGPVYYDVASFVWQARSCFPRELKRKMVETYIGALEKFRQVDRPAFMSRLRTFVLFRTMQVLGAYGFRGCVQKKQHFIDSIPFALANLRELLAEPFAAYPYLSELLSKVAVQGAKPAPGQKAVGKAVGEAAGQTKTAAENAVQNSAQEAAQNAAGLTIEVCSFSYKKGLPADDSGNGGGYLFDCRGLNNPGRYERYRHSTGRDADVIAFLEEDGGVFPYLEHVYGIVDPHVENFISRNFTHLSVGFGCTGGQHRSVYCAEHLAAHLAAKYGPKARIALSHRELGIKEIL